MSYFMKIRKVRKLQIILLFLVIGSLCQSCKNIANPSPTSIDSPPVMEETPSPNFVHTISAYGTQISAITLTAQSLLIPTPTGTATVTPIPPTAVPTSTSTQVLRDCNWAEFVSDVTIPDNTEIGGGTAFIKTWRFRNIGECTWTTDYDIVFVGGETFDAPMRVGMPRTVEPGETVDISLLMEAPTYPGSYTGYFMLSNGEGESFGTGVYADQQFWVRIIVRSPDNVILNLEEIYCKATWRSSIEGSLPCPGDASSDVTGFILRQENPIREDGAVENEPGLLASPDNSNYGFIYGIFPSFVVQKGDVFKSIIGCAYDSPGCDLIFELRYQIEGSAMHTIKSWGEIYDGFYHSIIVDLSDLAGFNVNLILLVENVASENNIGVWIAPRIMR